MPTDARPEAHLEAREPSRHLEAFKEGFNAFGLAGAVAASAALLNPIPLVAALAAEAAYLAFVPRSAWYERRLAQREDAAARDRREALKREAFPVLRPVLQARWRKLENLQEAIRAQAREQYADDLKFLRPIERKLDYLLEKWLEFAQRETELSADLATAAHEAGAPEENPLPGILAFYDREVAKLKERAEAEASFEAKALIENRARVLERRRVWVERLARVRESLSHHLELIEDSLGLIHDQVRARSPEMLLADLESVVQRSGTTAQLLNEFSVLERA